MADQQQQRVLQRLERALTLHSWASGSLSRRWAARSAARSLSVFTGSDVRLDDEYGEPCHQVACTAASIYISAPETARSLANVWVRHASAVEGWGTNADFFSDLLDDELLADPAPSYRRIVLGMPPHLADSTLDRASAFASEAYRFAANWLASAPDGVDDEWDPARGGVRDGLVANLRAIGDVERPATGDELVPGWMITDWDTYVYDLCESTRDIGAHLMRHTVARTTSGVGGSIVHAVGQRLSGVASTLPSPRPEHGEALYQAARDVVATFNPDREYPEDSDVHAAEHVSERLVEASANADGNDGWRQVRGLATDPPRYVIDLPDPHVAQMAESLEYVDAEERCAAWETASIGHRLATDVMIGASVHLAGDIREAVLYAARAALRRGDTMSEAAWRIRKARAGTAEPRKMFLWRSEFEGSPPPITRYKSPYVPIAEVLAALEASASDAVLVVASDSPVQWTPDAEYDFSPALPGDLVARFSLVHVPQQWGMVPPGLN